MAGADAAGSLGDPTDGRGRSMIAAGRGVAARELEGIGMRMLFTCLGAAAAVVAIGTKADAATATANMGISLTITAQCTVVSASTMAFPSTGLLNANVDQTATITVLCTNTTPYTISLDKGLYGSSVSARLMQGTGGSPDTVSYSLFRDASRTQNWGQTIGTDTVAGTGTGSNIATTVYGRIPPQVSKKPDNYTDTITVTVTY